jgi:hypothetical protein
MNCLILRNTLFFIKPKYEIVGSFFTWEILVPDLHKIFKPEKDLYKVHFVQNSDILQEK